MKLKAALLICTALVMPTAAQADPITAFFGGFLNALGAGTFLASGAVGAWSAGFSAASWLTGTTLGSLLLNIGVNYLLTPKPKAPTVEAARVNSRLANSPRWQLAGTVLAGGEVGVFAEHDEAGNFWYIVAHGDAEMLGEPQYYLDSVPVTLSDGTDGHTAGDVVTDAFCYGSAYIVYNGAGTKYPIFRIYTVTPTTAAAYGALPAAFTTAFPSLPADFHLSGVAFSIIRCEAIPLVHYGTHMRHRGPIGIGEPQVTVAADWNRVYDPREVGHDIDDPATWESSGGNPALIWAWWRTHGIGRNRPHTEINWTLIDAAADACDATVLDRTATAIPRYRCGIAFPDSKTRQECEQDILATMAGFVAYDDQGRAYPVPGIYEAPTVTFTRDRDIISHQTQVVDDGENMIDGVIVEYLSPMHNWARVECAPWVNTAYYDGVAEPNYRKVSIEGCQNHNQAVRLAKAIGLEIGATHRAALNTTVKGILAEGHRNITLDLDEEFTGVFKIASPIEEDPQGMGCGFAVVPMASDFYNMLPGEEGVPPALTPVLDIDNTIEAAAGVVVTDVDVATSTGFASRIEATFDAPSRVDRTFRFRFSLDGAVSPVYEDMVVDMDELRAWSPILPAADYLVQWQTVSGSGAATDWSAGTVVTVSLGITRLSLDFAAGAYQIDGATVPQSAVLSLTRASTATYLDSSGVIQTAAVDAVRFDWTDGSRALLVEPAATNLAHYSEQLDNAYWVKTRATVTANASVAPDGNTTMDRIVPTAAVDSHYITSGNASYISGLDYVTSCYVLAAGYNFLRLGLPSGAFAASGRQATFNLATGAIDGAQAGVGYGITSFGGGLYRVWVTCPAISTTTGYAAALAVNNASSATAALLSFAGDTTSGIDVWGVQTEVGTVPTSYIPTAGVDVTRAADVASLQGLTALLDLDMTYGDAGTASLSSQSVYPGYWPALTQHRIRQIIGRTP